ncbi:uncharacterized protein [Littorina saxatilis]|uniref:C1q domain-containing protein n=1 Tax=Littorina saxatilis TaxID=31220 RepID=A0AAN9GEU6_9CAEN
MSLPFAQIVAVLAITFAGSYCFQWTADIPDGTVKYACVDDVLRLPWDFTATTGDVIMSLQWLFEGFSQEVIAFDAHGSFFPTPSFSNRVQFLAKAGLALSHVAQGDTGNYSVEISGHDASGLSFSSRRTVIVRVIGNNTLMTSDGDLHARLEPQALYSNTTGRSSLVLSCGNFTYLSDPPFTMEWLTPSETIVPSDGYTDGHFQLFVTSGGDYTCRIPQHAAADVCLDDDFSRNATVHVDRMEARLTLMEARQDQLEKENEQLKQRETSLEAQLDNKNSSLYQSLQNLTSKVSRQVAFTAHLHINHPANGTVIFDRVITNLGNGYSSSTGNFTAPVAGLYFFMLTSSPQTNNDNSQALMYYDGSFLCYAASEVGMPGKVTSCGAAAHLSAGQRAWVTSRHNLTNYYTSFSGVLVNSD